jgi:hypothetical protein
MSTSTDKAQRTYCVIGAGASGLTVLKNFLERGVDAVCLEREDDVGGNWYFGRSSSRVYQSAHLISSKRLTEYSDYPMPDDYPEYPSHVQAWEYLRSYARHFGLYSHIEFNTAVERVEPDGPLWRVTLANGQVRRYSGVVIANGHNWDPRWPEYPGEFHGLALHSADYKTPDVLAGKRVLVVGAGNSGCDIAVEAAQRAALTFHSSRRGYHYLPKFLRGKPIDVCGERLLRWRIPLWLRRRITAAMVKLAIGSPQDFGLPKPDHRFFETHPIINSQMLYYVGHGDIKPKPDIAELFGDRIRFVDGSIEEIDVVVYATGFNITFPFIEREHLNWNGERPHLYLNIFHPRYDNLFVAGLIQPDSGQWGLVDYQAQLIARFIRAQQEDPAGARRFQRRKASEHVDVGHGIHYVRSKRHLLEVEHFSYRNRLKKLIAEFA